MRRLILVAVMVIMFGTGFAAQPEVTRHISREAAIKVLRDGGILWGKIRIVSAEWGRNTREWLVTLQHPDGKLSAWFVDAAGQNYHGGPCKH